MHVGHDACAGDVARVAARALAEHRDPLLDVVAREPRLRKREPPVQLQAIDHLSLTRRHEDRALHRDASGQRRRRGIDREPQHVLHAPAVDRHVQ